MSDRESRTRLREAESQEERVDSLRARLRSGDLSHDVIALCAAIGHGPAVAVLGAEAPAGDHLPWDLWSEALRREDWLELQAIEARNVSREVDAGLRELRQLRSQEESDSTPAPETLAAIARLEASGETLLARLSELIAWDGCGQPPRVDRVSRYDERFWLRRLSTWVTFHDCYDNLSSEDAEQRGYQLAHLTKLPELGPTLVPRLLGVRFEEVEEAPSSLDYLESRRSSGELCWSDLEIAAAAGHDEASQLTGVEQLDPFLRWLDAQVDLPFSWVRSLTFSLALDVGLHFAIGLRNGPSARESSSSEVSPLSWLQLLALVFAPPPDPSEEWFEVAQQERPQRVAALREWLRSQAAAARESQRAELERYAAGWESLVSDIDEGSAAATIGGITQLWRGLSQEHRDEVEETLRRAAIRRALSPEARDSE